MSRQLAALCAAVSAHLTLVRLFSWKSGLVTLSPVKLNKNAFLGGLGARGKGYGYFLRKVIIVIATCVTSSVHRQVRTVLEDLIITC